MSGVRQEEDRVQTGRIVKVGLLAFAIFGVGIWWAVLVQRGQTGTIRSDTAPPPALAGKTEIGMVYQPVFDRGKGIAADRSASQRERLGSYGANADHATVHVPIERAMKLVVERGKL
jgi:hypothetical protein